jgi:transcriptional regulator with XRE-family HTH domain
MSTKSQIKHPLIATELSRKTLRARLSLRETQEEFAARFMVSRVTVHNWETGKSFRMQNIHRRILDVLLKNLAAEGRLIDDSIFDTIYRENVASKGLDDFYNHQG